MGLSGPTRPHGWCAGRVGVGCLWQPAHLDPNFDPNPDELRRPQAHLSGRMGPFLISKRTPADGPKRIRGICKTAIPGSIPGVASSRLRSKWPPESDFWGRSPGLDGIIDGKGIQPLAPPATNGTGAGQRLHRSRAPEGVAHDRGGPVA